MSVHSFTQAGIQTDHLLISLEPEAASVYCQYLPTEKLSGSSSGFTVFKPGTKYMIIDLGGTCVTQNTNYYKNVFDLIK